MKIEFLKNHTLYKLGNIVENHPNEVYLIRVGAAKEYVEANKKSIKKDGKL